MRNICVRDAPAGTELWTCQMLRVQTVTANVFSLRVQNCADSSGECVYKTWHWKFISRYPNVCASKEQKTSSTNSVKRMKKKTDDPESSESLRIQQTRRVTSWGWSCFIAATQTHFVYNVKKLRNELAQYWQTFVVWRKYRPQTLWFVCAPIKLRKWVKRPESEQLKRLRDNLNQINNVISKMSTVTSYAGKLYEFAGVIF